MRRAAWRGERCSFILTRTGGPPSSTSSGRVISIAMSFGRVVALVEAALHAHDGVVLESVAVVGHRLREHHHLDRGRRSSSTNVAMRSPRFVYLRFERGDDAAHHAHLALRASRSSVSVESM